MLTNMPKKRVGVFSLTCDEGCSIYLTEIFNHKLIEWLDKIELVYFLSVKDKVEFNELDIALIEGVVSSEKEKKELVELRGKSKIIIAMGSCAITTQPSGQRNSFSAEQTQLIQPKMQGFDYLPKCLALKDVVTVDAEIMGCPIDQNKFIEIFEKYL
jgi:sulfhydrogenase subunit delta